MSRYSKQKRHERRARKGLRRHSYWGGVVPPSDGWTFWEIGDDILYDPEFLFAFVRDHHEMVKIRHRNIQFAENGQMCRLDFLEGIYQVGGIAGLARIKFPQQYLIEMKRDDRLEVKYRLLFS